MNNASNALQESASLADERGPQGNPSLTHHHLQSFLEEVTQT